MNQLTTWIADLPSNALWGVACAFLFCIGLITGRHRTRWDRRLDQRTIDFGSGVTRKAKVGQLVYEKDHLLMIYETDYKYLYVYPSSHIMKVPCDLSAVSFSMGILLTFDESAKVKAGDWGYFENLAQQVQNNPFRFVNIPIAAPEKLGI